MVSFFSDGSKCLFLQEQNMAAKKSVLMVFTSNYKLGEHGEQTGW